tara:strand:- start:425 stop:853 length:429 start_codon:yes stop_codon:yes gene_type:complete
MAYKGYKGCGPKKLGSSPLKQKFETTQYDKNIQNLSDSEKSSYKKGQDKAINIAGAVATVIPAVRAVSTVVKGAKALKTASTAVKNAKALSKFSQKIGKDLTKTVKTGSPKPITNSGGNIRAGFNGPTSTASRPNYNNIGSN